MELLTNILLFIILGLFLGAGLFLYVLFRKIKANTLEFFIPPDDKTPSQFAKVTEAISFQFSRAIVAQAKTTFMGMESGQVRAEKALQGDLALDMAESNGLMKALSMFPNVRKTLRRNPALIDLALPMLAKLGNNGGNNTGSGPGPATNSPKFKL